jgi:hypothetical protein
MTGESKNAEAERMIFWKSTLRTRGRRYARKEGFRQRPEMLRSACAYHARTSQQDGSLRAVKELNGFLHGASVERAGIRAVCFWVKPVLG